MSAGPPNVTERATLIDRLVDDFQTRLAAGEVVTESAILTSHPELMPELGEQLRFAKLLQRVDQEHEQSLGSQLRLRCPHCQRPFDVGENDELSTIVCPSCGGDFSLADSPGRDVQLQAGRNLGHFELLKRLGGGAFGAVWSARDTQLDRVVAIKIPRKGLLSAGEAENFLREARVVASLSHPNIVRVYEVGRDGDLVYIVTDLIKGMDLADWLEDKHVTISEAVKWSVKLADALAHAHAGGVIHRDLKPSNILIDQQSEPHLVDFGLAKQQAGDVTMTLDGKLLGTPAYMSPEQARGNAHDADARSDVYSLGVILFELLTGERPFRGTVRMLLEQILTEEPPSPRKLNGRISRDLETICLKCLEKDAESRYQTADSLRDDLARFLRHEPVLARPVSRTAKVWRWCQRKPGMAGALAALAFVTLCGFSAVSWQWNLTRVQRDAARWQSYRASIGAASNAWGLHQADALRSALDQTPEEHRNWEWDFFHNQLDVSEGILGKHGEAYARVGFSRDGARVFSFNRRDTIVWDVASRKEIARLTTKSIVSRDGMRVATVGEDGIVQITHAATDQEITSLGPITLPVQIHGFSPDGSQLATRTGEDGPIETWNLESGKRIAVMPAHSCFEHTTRFSRDNTRLATTGHSSGDAPHNWFVVRLFNATTGEEIDISHGSPKPAQGFVMSHDGTMLAVQGFFPSTFISIHDTKTGNLVAKLKGHRDTIQWVEFSPDGKHCVSASRDKSLRMWDIAKGKTVFLLSGYHSQVHDVAFTADGSMLATTSEDKTIRFWDAAIGEPLFALLGSREPVVKLAFSPDQSMIATGSTEGTVRLWDLESLQQSVLRGHGSVVNDVAFDSSGSRLASAGWDNTVRVWDLNTGQETLSLNTESHALAVAFTGGNQFVATLEQDGDVRMFDATSGEQIWRKKLPPLLEEYQSGLAVSPGGSEVAVSATDGIHVWNVQTGDEVVILQQSGGPTPLAFSPNGLQLVSARESTHAWNSRTWELFSSINLPATCQSFTFNHDSSQLAVVLKGSKVMLCDTERWLPLETLEVDSPVHDAVFNHDGTRLTLACDDNTVRLWDTATCQEVAVLRGHRDSVLTVAFSPDGSQLASASRDGTIRRWISGTSRQQRE